jgi:hypothetical protein
MSPRHFTVQYNKNQDKNLGRRLLTRCFHGIKLQSHGKINTKKSSCLTKKKQILCCQINHLAQDFLTLYELCKLINYKYISTKRFNEQTKGKKRLHCFQNSSLSLAVLSIGNFIEQQEKICAVTVLIFYFTCLMIISLKMIMTIAGNQSPCSQEILYHSANYGRETVISRRDANYT